MNDAEIDFAPRPIRPLLTSNDFLRIVPVSNTTLAWLIKTGRLPAVKIKGRLFFEPDAVEKFLRACSE